MNSPVLNILSSYIRLNRKDSTPIYLQITQGIINAIHTKALIADTKLPGTRLLSEKLFVHRNTVTAAYEDLSAQGWIDIIPQKGALVSNKKLKNTPNLAFKTMESSSTSSFDLSKNVVLDSPYKPIKTDYYFTEGTADHRIMPLKTLNQIFASILSKKSTTKNLNKELYRKNENLNNQLINYLQLTKAYPTHTNQLLVVQNNQIALQSTIKTILKPQDKIVVIEPSDFSVNMILKQAYADIISIKPQQFLDLQFLEKLIIESKIRAIYLYNQLQSLNSSYDLEYKENLLVLAQKHRFVIIEDDNGSDFNYSKLLTDSFKKLDKQGSVIYLNSLQQLLPAPFDIAYIWAPNNVIEEIAKVKNTFQSASILLIEETIANYISEGLLLNQLHKNTKMYLKRRDNMLHLLHINLEQNIEFEIPQNGLTFWLTFHQKLPLLGIAKYCENKNLTIPSYLLFQNQDTTGLKLGFGHLNETEAEQAIKILTEGIYQHLYK